MKFRRFLRVSAWTLVAILVAGHLLGGWFYSESIIDDHLAPQPQAFSADDAQVPVEEIVYSSPAGEFDALYVPASGSVWVIHVHSPNSTPLEPQAVFAEIQESGYPQLSIAYRNDFGQPGDSSDLLQYGAVEWEDVGGAFDYAIENGASKVVFAGYGGGASLAMSFVYRHNFDKIAGVILDSGTIDLSQTIDFQASQKNLPLVSLQMPFTVPFVGKFITSLRTGVNFQTIDYIDRSERSLRVPVLAIHGTEDAQVSQEQPLDLADLNPELVSVSLFEASGHLENFETDYSRYIDEVLDFLRSVR